MNTECLRIADQLRRAFDGKAWHGPSLKELLADVTVQQAHAHPVAHAHSIWELVLHIDVWMQAADDAVRGVPMPKIVGTEKDWPPVTDASETAWSRAVTTMFESAARLSHAIAPFEDARLSEIVPGRPQYTFYVLFHGVIQHSLYHGGQIALLKRAASEH
jgi:hypothetical protein